VGRIGTALLGIAVNIMLARLLPHDAYGAYFLAFTAAFVGGTFAQLGLERTVVRLVASALGTDRPGRARAAVWITFQFGALGAMVFAGAFFIGLGDFMAKHLYHSSLVANVTVITGAWLVTMAFQSLFAETFRGFQRFWLATLFDGLLVDIFLVLVFGVLVISRAHPSLHVVIALSAGVTAATFLVATPLLVRRVRSLPRRGDDLRGREVFAIAWPLWVFNVTTFLVGTGSDILVVGAVRGQTTVAYYGAAARLVFFVGAPFIIVSQVVPPIIAELWAQGRKHQLEASLREISTIAAAPALVVLLAFVLFGGPIMAILYGGKFFAAGGAVLAILSVARMVAAATGSSGSALQMTGYQRSLMYLTMVIGAVSLTMGIVLGRTFGAIGVAVATATAQICQNLGQLFLAKKRLGIWTHMELSFRPFKELLGIGK
jgi:O-antigen/teichoic acid export membrane protein